MGTKRPHPTSEASRPPNKRSRPNDQKPFKSKPSTTGPTSARIYPKATYSINELKSSVRALSRLLTRSAAGSKDLPATVRVEKERALASAKRELAFRLRARRRTEMIERFHKVRFFDRQKATRRLKKARRELEGHEEGADGWEEAKERVEDAEIAVQYTLCAPLDWAYVSLYPARRGKEDAGEGEDGKDERRADVEMWELVKRCMADGTLEELREGRLTDENGKVQETKPKMQKAKKSSKTAQTKEHDDHDDDESDNESGGGFFE